MTAHMYILKCSDNSYYTGSTKDLEKRLWQHQIELVYAEAYDRIDEAFAREKQIQGWGRKKKEALMCGDFDALEVLSVCQNESICTSITSTPFPFGFAQGTESFKIMNCY